MLIEEDLQKEELLARLTEVGQGYQKTLMENPRHPVALLGMSLIAIASHQFAAAANMAQAAVEIVPQMGPAWVTLGQALKSCKRYDEAEQAYRKAISLDGMDPLARAAMGELKITLEQPEEAIKEYELALRKSPMLIPAHLGLGHSLACMGRFEEALERYQKALAFRPRLAEAEFAAGYSLARLGRVREAEVRYRKALTLRPDFAAAWMNMGSLFRDQGRDVYAEAALFKALELRPDMIGAWVNLGLLERDRRNMEKAAEYLSKALALDSTRVDTLIAWCQFRLAEKDMAGAWSWLRWALLQDPDNAEAVNMYGIMKHYSGCLEEAVKIFEHAEELGNLAASSNRGNSLLDLDRVEEALQAHEKAVERNPEGAGAKYNLAMTRLRMGDYKRGWQGYEARWDFREVHRLPRVFRQPRWKGEPLEGKSVLIHAEQGLGDTIQFCRYVPLIVARGGVPLLQVQIGVMKLLKSMGVVQSGEARIAELGIKPPDFDLECPLMSLPAIFGTTLDTVPWSGAYLGADPELAKEKRKLLSGERAQREFGQPPLRVGIAWAGNPSYKADRYRSTKLETLYPLLRVPGISWVSLQKGDPIKQLCNLPKDLFVWDGCSQDRDLSDTAAVIDSLDLVITTDTCIAHLAGAMGKPVWILLPHLADWRWMRRIETTPWYPTARLLRQRKQGDWDGLVQRVIDDLERYKLSNAWPTMPVWQQPQAAPVLVS
jgi:tetratricopeptide (TPR) repeat protein